jgi:hypothetical protein
MKQRMKILIGYDGSGCAEAALDDLQKAGLPPAVEALVMSVTEVSLPPPPPSSFEIVEQAREVHVPTDIIAKGRSLLASVLLSVATPTAHSEVPAMKLAEAEKHIGHDPLVVRGCSGLQSGVRWNTDDWSLLPEDHPTK